MSTTASPSSIIRLIIIGLGLVIILAGIRAAAPILNPIFLALFFAILLSPIFGWLQRKSWPTWLVVATMIVGAIAIGLGLIAFLVASFNQLAASLPDYQTRLAEQSTTWQAWLAGVGIEPQQLLQLLARFLAGAINFLSISVFILMTIIFMLLEGSSFSARLQAAIGADNPLLARLSRFSQSMIRYFGVRSLINLLTGGAVTIMLIILGIDFPLLWGVLTFFLSYIPYIGITVATIPAVLLAPWFSTGRAGPPWSSSG